MHKQIVLIHENDKIVEVLDVKSVTSYENYVKLVEEARKNKESIEEEKANKEKEKQEEFDVIVKGLLLRLERAEIEIDLLRGRITEEEYNERMQSLCGTK